MLSSIQFNIGFRAWLPPIPADDHRPNLRFELQQRREAPRSATKGHGRGGRGRQGGQGQGTTSQAEQHNSRMRRQFPLRIGNSASLSPAFISSPPFLSGHRRRRRAEGLAGPERGLRGHRRVLLRPPVEILAGMSTL